MDERYESIKAKLKKLYELSVRGVNGEADNARRLLEKLCRENGITIEELLDQNKKECYIFNVGRNNMYQELFEHCVYKVLQVDKYTYRQPSRSEISLELTAYQYAELKGLYEWHKINFKKDFDELKNNIVIAYIRKHHIFNDIVTDEHDSKPLTAKQLARLLKIAIMEKSLNDNNYQKLLEG